MKRDDFELERLEAHYSQLVRAHGDAPASAQWSDRPSQEARMRVLCEVGDLRHAKVLDFGCGTGHLLTFLRASCGFDGEYVGYDLSEEALAVARGKFPGVRFERKDVLTSEGDEEFDYVIASGVFNNLVKDNWGFMTTVLPVLYRRARRAVAFNALSTYVDFFDEGLFYVAPDKVFAWCKTHLSPLVTLRNDYQLRAGVVPFEFAIYAYRTEVACRPSR
jgi:cyclopropane fatty-acyl-phospholipid synthase-like methyltransferase